MDESESSELLISPDNINSFDSLNSVDTSLDPQTSDMGVDNSLPTEIRKLQSMYHFQITEVCKTDECRDLINYLRKFSSNLVTGQPCPNIGHIVDNDNCIEFFRRYIIHVSDNCSDMLVNISQRQYLNFIKFVMSLWNMSDKFDFLCERMAALDIHTYLIRLIGKMKITPELLETKQILLLVMSMVGILHNINNKIQYTRSRYRDEHLVNYLMPLAALSTTKELIGLKTAALLLLAFLVNENENNVLNANDEHIIYILGILRNTLDAPQLYSKHYGYHSLEILNGLRHIASPDNNKRSLINNGVLLSIEVVLRLKSEENYQREITAGLELLWSLSFSKECLTVLSEESCPLKSLVEELGQGSNQSIVLSAKGILWNINAQRSLSINNLILNDIKTSNILGHVMISYQHSTQDVMIKIKENLSANGYDVWMDVDHMRGSFVDAMAEGIQHASVLLLGLCQAFKNSPHCRQEVKYAYTLGIPLVPVMLEPGFTPDGWLGLMCATLIYTEFIDPIKFDNNMVQLQRQLGTFGKMSHRPSTNGDPVDGPSVPRNAIPCNLMCCQEGQVPLQPPLISQPHNETMVNSSSDILTSARSDHSSSIRLFPGMSTESNPIFRVDSTISRNNDPDEEQVIGCYICTQNAKVPQISELPRYHVLEWTTSQCTEWLAKHSIDVESYGYPLSEFDGPLLFELAEMRIVAPESYFIAIREELKLNFIDKLNLCRALRKLDELT